jgi:hypothetical protein
MLIPERLRSPQQGLCFSRASGHLFRPEYLSDDSNQLLWDNDNAALLRQSPLAEFLADVDFDDKGYTVTFTRMEGGREVLAQTKGLNEGARLPRASFLKLQAAERELKAMIGRGILSEQEEAFVAAFRLPDPKTFPAAYRVKQAGLFSSRKLYVLWGLVPELPRVNPTISIELGGSVSSGLPNGGAAPRADGSPVDPAAQSEHEFYDDSRGWPKWLEALVVLCGLALLLIALWLILSLLPQGCEVFRGEESPVKAAVAVPEPDQEQELRESIEKLRRDIPPQADERDARRLRLYALERALAQREEARRDKKSAEAAAAAARQAEARSKETGRADDVAKALELQQEADVKKREADESASAAGRAFVSPQEQLRRAELAQNERLKELSRQAEKAKQDAAASGLAEDRAKAQKLRDEADSAKRSLPGLPLSPRAEKDARDKLYVTPKSSRQSGEVVVRRFKADELVAKKGIKLHLEADGNGRKDFKVKGWAFGVSSIIETERLEGFVPVGPGLSIDTPLDLYFEYRGDDGQIHEDCAPFVITGDIEFSLSLEIERAEENPPPAPTTKPKPGA